MKNCKNIQIVLLVLSNLVFASAYSADVPRASSRDSRIQYIEYRDNDVVLLNVVAGTGSRIVFSNSETIVNIASGFAQGWEFLPVNNELYVSARSLQLNAEGPLTRPEPGEWDTNLMVTTSRGLYDFDIRLLDKDGREDGERAFYRVQFEYTDTNENNVASIPVEANNLLGASPGVEASQDNGISLNNARIVAANDSQANEEFAEGALEKRLPPQNDQYSMTIGAHSKGIAPTIAYDDGLFTYLKFPSNLDIPSAYLVRNNGGKEVETLVNGHIDPDRPEFVVLHRITQKIRLRLDDAVVDIHNENFNPSNVKVKDGTTIPGVKRVLK